MAAEALRAAPLGALEALPVQRLVLGVVDVADVAAEVVGHRVLLLDHVNGAALDGRLEDARPRLRDRRGLARRRLVRHRSGLNDGVPHVPRALLLQALRQVGLVRSRLHLGLVVLLPPRVGLPPAAVDGRVPRPVAPALHRRGRRVRRRPRLLSAEDDAPRHRARHGSWLLACLLPRVLRRRPRVPRADLAAVHAALRALLNVRRAGLDVLHAGEVVVAAEHLHAALLGALQPLPRHRLVLGLVLGVLPSSHAPGPKPCMFVLYRSSVSSPPPLPKGFPALCPGAAPSPRPAAPWTAR